MKPHTEHRKNQDQQLVFAGKSIAYIKSIACFAPTNTRHFYASTPARVMKSSSLNSSSLARKDKLTLGGTRLRRPYFKSSLDLFVAFPCNSFCWICGMLFRVENSSAHRPIWRALSSENCLEPGAPAASTSMLRLSG